MADKYYEDPLDSLLDEQSDEHFGLPEIRDKYEHGAREEKLGDLRHWSAEDFASIYVRFRPHLERHARRWLANPSQAEEVVQDAFLYLMTSLPEIDNELGVLKFLKWKVRLLALDVLRSASQKREVTVAEHADLQAEEDDIIADLERAEDSAVIRLALAKLNPRQREALVASVYEDKPAEVIAEQMGLTPNATRQLLFRAKGAFRKALVGEAEVHGKSISQVLSIAARKAAKDVRENAVRVGVFLVLSAFAVGSLPSLLGSMDETNLVATPPTIIDRETESEPSSGRTGELSDASPSEFSQEVSEPVETSSASQTSENASGESFEVAQSSNGTSSPNSELAMQDQPSVPAPDDEITAENLTDILRTNVSTAGFYENSYSPMLSEGFRGISVEVFGGTGISAFLDVNPVKRTINGTVFQLLIEGKQYFGIATTVTQDTLLNPEGYTVFLEASDFYVIDESGNVFDDSPFVEAEASVTLDLDESGRPLGASMLVERS